MFTKAELMVLLSALSDSRIMRRGHWTEAEETALTALMTKIEAEMRVVRVDATKFESCYSQCDGTTHYGGVVLIDGEPYYPSGSDTDTDEDPYEGILALVLGEDKAREALDDERREDFLNEFTSCVDARQSFTVDTERMVVG